MKLPSAILALVLFTIAPAAHASCPIGVYAVERFGGSTNASSIEIRDFAGECSIKGVSGGWLTTVPKALESLRGNFAVGATADATLMTISPATQALLRSNVVSATSVEIEGRSIQVVKIEIVLDIVQSRSKDRYEILFSPDLGIPVEYRLQKSGETTATGWRLLRLPQSSK